MGTESELSRCKRCPIFRSALALVATASTLELITTRSLKGMSLSYCQDFVQLGMLLGSCVQLVAVREWFASADQTEALCLTLQLAAGLRTA